MKLRFILAVVALVATGAIARAQEFDVQAFTPQNKETLKEIISGETGLKIVGWVDKQKHYADGSPIEIWEWTEGRAFEPGSGIKILEGRVSQDGGTTFIDGVLYNSINYLTLEYPDKGIIGRRFLQRLGKKKGQSSDDRITGRFAVSNTDDGKLLANKKLQKKNGKEIPFTIKEQDIKECSTTTTPEELGYSDLKYKDLIIPVSITKQPDGSYLASINPTCFTDLWPKKAAVVEKTLKSVNKYIGNDSWHVVFENGDEWWGRLFFRDGGERGTYRFANGEAITGELPEDFVFGLDKWPIWVFRFGGRIDSVTLIDGSIINQPFWSDDFNYGDFDFSDAKDIYKESGTITEFHDKIIATQQAKLAAEQAEKESKDKKFRDLRAWAKRNYGSFGEDVSNGKLTIGMTKKMVETAMKIYFAATARQLNVIAAKGYGMNTDPDVYTFESIYSPVKQTTTEQIYKMGPAGEILVGKARSILKFRNGKLAEIRRGM